MVAPTRPDLQVAELKEIPTPDSPFILEAYGELDYLTASNPAAMGVLCRPAHA
jgi:hypothetical protein